MTKQTTKADGFTPGRYFACPVKGSSRVEILDSTIDGGEGEPLIVASFFTMKDAEAFCAAANAFPEIVRLREAVRVDPVPRVWVVACTEGHDHDLLVFATKQQAEEQAELFNDVFPEGENPYKAEPLYAKAALDAAGGAEDKERANG